MKTHQGVIHKIVLDGGSPKQCDHQGIIKRKSVSGGRTLPLIIIDKKTIFPKIVLFYSISGKN